MESYKRNVFLELDKDRSGFIDEGELYIYFCKEFGVNFNPHAIKLVVGMFKFSNYPGLTLQQFSDCYDLIERWKCAFYNLDVDKSGTIGPSELNTAINGYGFFFSPGMINLIIKKFDSTHRGSLTFVDFFRAMVTVKMLNGKYCNTFIQTPYINYGPQSTISFDQAMFFAMNNADLIVPNLLPPK